MFRHRWRSTQYLTFTFVIRTGLSALFVLIFTLPEVVDALSHQYAQRWAEIKENTKQTNSKNKQR